MKTYQFDTMIKGNGTILLPEAMKTLYHHRVKLIVIDLEPLQPDPVSLFSSITQRYSMLQEPDINIADIYEHRTHQHDRGLVFT